MKPLIKWPGGKSREIKHIREFIPEFNRYIEPFVGGGALFFELKPNNAIINDVDLLLIKFYQFVKSKNPEFKKGINQIVDDWRSLNDLIKPLYDFFSNQIQIGRKNSGKLQEFKPMLSMIEHIPREYYLKTPFDEYLLKSIESKTKRVINLERIHSIEFDLDLLEKHLETAIRAGYYTMLRDEPITSEIDEVTRFYFIREFCYGSMFRFNKSGKFNIPYGGINYNQKSFAAKVNNLWSKNTHEVFSSTEIFNTDFERFFEQIKPQDDDFIFFDPPYDSDFKNYGKNPFTKEDHERLAQEFAKLKSKALMVIGGSPFISDLYHDLSKKYVNIKINNYPVKYTYNVRGRNNRRSNHLIITNY